MNEVKKEAALDKRQLSTLDDLERALDIAMKKRRDRARKIKQELRRVARDTVR